MSDSIDKTGKTRLMSLDALRGFDMFWIIGGSGMIVALVELLGFPDSWVEVLAVQMTHVEWDGFRFFDLIFPLFVFISGVTVPYPGKGSVITPENNLAAWLDRNLISTNLYREVWDPEGTIRVATGGMLGMLGGLFGQRIKSYQKASFRCGLELLLSGLVCLLLGWLWSFFFPIIKGLWSPSFVLWAGGWSLLILALFYTVIDVLRLRWLGWFFVPIGMNAITIYAAQWYIPLDDSRDFFFKGFANLFTNPAAQQFILYGGLIMIQWLILYWLYRKRIFIRI